MTDSSTLSSSNASQQATDVTRTDTTMTETSPFVPYAGLFNAANVASVETGRFTSVRKQVRTWVEAGRCRYVAVGPGKVTRPRVFVAEVQSKSGTALLSRLFPAEEQYDRRLGVGDQVVVVLSSVWTGGRPKRHCFLFRRADD